MAGFCSTQLTDTERETNGLLTANPGPKLDPKSIRAIHARLAASVPHDVTAATRKRGQGGGGKPRTRGGGRIRVRIDGARVSGDMRPWVHGGQCRAMRSPVPCQRNDA